MALSSMKLVKDGSKNALSTQDFLTNWYQNRVIPDSDFQEAYERDKPFFLERMKNLPTVKTVEDINEIGNSGNVNRKLVTGQYVPKENLILMRKDANPWTLTHEMNHAINDIDRSYTYNVHKDIIENEIKPKEELSGPYKDKYEYFTNPDEVHSRIMVLRQAAGIKPNQVVTPEYLDNFIKNYKGENSNINDLLKLSKDKEGLLNMLNYMAANKQNLNSNQV